MPQADSLSLANFLLGRLTTPSLAAIRAEMRVRLQDVLNAMDPIDREVLVLRHFEELTNGETAAILGLQKAAASNRYVRALRRLTDILATMPGFLERGASLGRRDRSMDSSTSDRNPFDRLAEEFALRVRRGERPPLSEYTARYPELADEIRRAFPAIVMMERLKPDSAELRGPDPARATSGRRAIPDRLGDYRILRFISEGGMGYVFEAVQESMGRRVALKVLKPEIVGQRQLARFLRESRAPGRLHHTNIVPIFGIGECDDLHYYAMQFIYGESLEKVIADLRHLRNGRCGPAPATGDAPPLPTPATLSRSLRTGRFADTDPDLESGPTAKNGAVALPASLAVPDRQPEAGGRASAPSSTSRPGLEQPSGRIFYKSVARIGEQVALAMGHAHRNGVLHRDIKPANLLLDLQGTVWVADFGLAHETDAEDLSRGDVVGTLRFIPPERFRGESLPQGDIYSLGLTLYELATLEPAFRGPDTRHLMHLIQHGQPRPPRSIDGEIPRDLETIILKAIDKDPRRRYATADAMAEDLLAFREDREIRSRRARWPERLVRWCRRNPAVAGLSGLALLLLFTIAVVLAVSAARLHREALRGRAPRAMPWSGCSAPRSPGPGLAAAAGGWGSATIHSGPWTKRPPSAVGWPPRGPTSSRCAPRPSRRWHCPMSDSGTSGRAIPRGPTAARSTPTTSGTPSASGTAR